MQIPPPAKTTIWGQIGSKGTSGLQYFLWCLILIARHNDEQRMVGGKISETMVKQHI